MADGECHHVQQRPPDVLKTTGSLPLVHSYSENLIMPGKCGPGL